MAARALDPRARNTRRHGREIHRREIHSITCARYATAKFTASRRRNSQARNTWRHGRESQSCHGSSLVMSREPVWSSLPVWSCVESQSGHLCQSGHGSRANLVVGREPFWSWVERGGHVAVRFWRQAASWISSRAPDRYLCFSLVLCISLRASPPPHGREIHGDTGARSAGAKYRASRARDTRARNTWHHGREIHGPEIHGDTGTRSTGAKYMRQASNHRSRKRWPQARTSCAPPPLNSYSAELQKLI